MAKHFIRCEDGSAISVDHVVRLSVHAHGPSAPEIVADTADSGEYPVASFDSKDEAQRTLLDLVNTIEQGT